MGAQILLTQKTFLRAFKNAHISVSICGTSRLSECQSIRSVRWCI